MLGKSNFSLEHMMMNIALGWYDSPPIEIMQSCNYTDLPAMQHSSDQSTRNSRCTEMSLEYLQVLSLLTNPVYINIPGITVVR